MSDIDRQIEDMLADGSIPDGDAEQVRRFRDFLAHAGPPAIKGQPSPDGKNMGQRLIEAGRPDLIAYAIGDQAAERYWWAQLDDDALLDNTIGVPGYDVIEVANRIERAIRDAGGYDAGTVLDLGCGTGRLTDHYAHRFPWLHVSGTDINERAIALALARSARAPNATYSICDGRTIPGDDLFSAAYSVAMFQHIPLEATWGYIRQVHERLRPGGAFIFTMAVGETDEFLNHQIPNTTGFLVELAQLFNSAAVAHDQANDWTWYLAEKEKS